MKAENLLSGIPAELAEELVTTILSAAGVRIGASFPKARPLRRGFGTTRPRASGWWSWKGVPWCNSRAIPSR